MSSKRSKVGSAWSTADIQRLRELAAAGAPLAIIAVSLHRTHSAIRNKAAMHGISLKASCTGSMDLDVSAAAPAP